MPDLKSVWAITEENEKKYDTNIVFVGGVPRQILRGKW